jgi:hypothetical protein
VNTSNQVELYRQIGQLITLSDLRNILSTSAPATTSTLLATNLPVLGSMQVNVGVSMNQANVTQVWAEIEDGDSTGTIYENVLMVSNGVGASTMSLRGEKTAVTDSSQRIRYTGSSATLTISISVRWFNLPHGF